MPPAGCSSERTRCSFSTVRRGAKSRSRGPPWVRGIAVDAAGRVWIGALNTIGYFETDRSGTYRFYDLTSRLPPGVQVGAVWKVFLDGPRVIFISHDRILCWQNDQLTVMRQFSETRRLLGVQADGKIYVDHVPSGLYQLQQGEPRLLIPAAELGFRAVLWLQPLPGGEFLLGTNTGFFRWRPGRLEPFAPGAAEWLTKGRFDSALVLPGGEILAGTELSGVGLISAHGQARADLDRTERIAGTRRLRALPRGGRPRVAAGRQQLDPAPVESAALDGGGAHRPGARGEGVVAVSFPDDREHAAWGFPRGHGPRRNPSEPGGAPDRRLLAACQHGRPSLRERGARRDAAR